MKCPKIVLSVSKNCGDNYIRAFRHSGFCPVADYLPSDTQADGLVLCGGGDVDPAYLGEPNRGSFPPDMERDRCEFSLIEKYYAAHKPIFGICRGMQMMNVAFGGGLIQHLPTSEQHTSDQPGDMAHEVINCPDTPAFRLFGPSMTVSSAHHQGCGKMGQGLHVMQQHADGTPEGLWGEGILAVQWHPERMVLTFRRPIYPDVLPLFLEYRNMF